MRSALPTDFYEYKDAELSMRIPSYLRPKKGMRFFAARSKKEKSYPLLNIAIEVLNDDLVKAHTAIMVRMVPGTVGEWAGLQGKIIRRGKAAYLADGLEMLGSSRTTANGKVSHDYNVLFLLGSHRIYATFMGQGEINVFDELCRAVVGSIRMADVEGKRGESDCEKNPA